MQLLHFLPILIVLLNILGRVESKEIRALRGESHNRKARAEEVGKPRELCSGSSKNACQTAPPTTLEPLPGEEDPSCSAYESCAHLGDGDCCPDSTGTRLPCCDLPGRACSVNPGCAVLNHTGDCCPTIDNDFLYCCAETPTAPPTTPETTPPLPAEEDPSCSAYESCAHLAGDCCPDATGTRLACCDLPGPACSLNPGCAMLGHTGACCPTIDNDFLYCCSETPLAPPTTPETTPPLPAEEDPCSTPPLPAEEDPSCSAHESCVHLAGDCCPDAMGMRLACCDHPGRACSLNPACVALNLAGNCCPSNDNIFLQCCVA